MKTRYSFHDDYCLSARMHEGTKWLIAEQGDADVVMFLDSPLPIALQLLALCSPDELGEIIASCEVRLGVCNLDAPAKVDAVVDGIAADLIGKEHPASTREAFERAGE